MTSGNVERATLGGGCFWCLDAVYRSLEGVLDVQSGYAGGEDPAPTYEAVCGGATGHAEVVQVAFDPSVIGYEDILEVFFTVHDPTTPNRQGADVGTQYRSIILYHDPKQNEVAEAVKARIDKEGLYEGPVVTEVVPLEMFYPAEDYHQDYFSKNPYQPYCMAVVRPKVAKFRKKWENRLKA